MDAQTASPWSRFCGPEYRLRRMVGRVVVREALTCIFDPAISWTFIFWVDSFLVINSWQHKTASTKQFAFWTNQRSFRTLPIAYRHATPFGTLECIWIAHFNINRCAMIVVNNQIIKTNVCSNSFALDLDNEFDPICFSVVDGDLKWKPSIIRRLKCFSKISKLKI